MLAAIVIAVFPFLSGKPIMQEQDELPLIKHYANRPFLSFPASIRFATVLSTFLRELHTPHSCDGN